MTSTASPISAQKPAQPVIAILLCTYNGAKFLEEQLDSFERQAHTAWRVWASDDGSSDQTLAILQKYQEKWGIDRLMILNGPHAGSTRNFMSLVKSREVEADYYAFSDQDDIWEADKLERALNWLQSQPQSAPLLYGSRTRLVDENNQDIGFSHVLQRPAGLRNALVQNIISGNTMVFNEAARQLIATPEFEVVIHDWWLYLAVCACGGVVHYDNHPSIRYRQHQDNQIGMSSGFSTWRKRIRRFFSGFLRTSIDTNLAALKTLGHALAPQSRELIEQFAASRTKRLIPRLVSLKRLGVYRQTTLNNAALFVAAVLKKL